MSALVNFSIKVNGEYIKLTASINDIVDQYGNNVAIFERQTKEQREAKEKKNYIGNGTVTWTDGNIVKAPFVEREGVAQDKKEDDLPF